MILSCISISLIGSLGTLTTGVSLDRVKVSIDGDSSTIICDESDVSSGTEIFGISDDSTMSVSWPHQVLEVSTIGVGEGALSQSGTR